MAGGAKPRRLAVERDLLETPLGLRLRERLPLDSVRDRIGPADYRDFQAGDLVLARHCGNFIKPCPGTRGYNCCGLEIIHFGLGCYLDCSYCVLQCYLDSPALVLFGNVEQGLAELDGLIDGEGPRPRRFCTGEFTDSLLLEDMTGLGKRLVEMFSRAKSAVLELKTKTVNIEGLLGLDHGGRTIISFSVNAPEISRLEESRTPPLKRRLEAAARAVENGYRLAFHFDPMIRHVGWRDGYRRAVDDIFAAVPADQIAWISMGVFRYPPGLKSIVRRRHPWSRIMDDEFILAEDGKMRLPRPLRVEMYSFMREAVQAADPGACLYMCMESPRVWREVFGFDPGPDGLVDLLDARVAPRRPGLVGPG
ncbi:MAG: DNA photolyase [Pseudomonadota bacterium]